MPRFDGSTGTVYFKSWRTRAPGSPAVVFLHGFGDHSGLYHRFGNALVAAGIDLWTLDEAGHGLSDGEQAAPGSLDDLIDNGRRLTALADAAEPGRPIFLAGHSLGAAAAALGAARNPAPYRGLIVSGAPLSPLEWVKQLSVVDGWAAISLDPADLSADPFYLEQLENDPLAFTGAEVGGSLARILPPVWGELRSSFPAIPLPVLFVHGAADPIVPLAIARDWSARVPSARLAEITGGRHDVLNDVAHREAAAAITDFIWSVTEHGNLGGATATAVLGDRRQVASTGSTI